MKYLLLMYYDFYSHIVNIGPKRYSSPLHLTDLAILGPAPHSTGFFHKVDIENERWPPAWRQVVLVCVNFIILSRQAQREPPCGSSFFVDISPVLNFRFDIICGSGESMVAGVISPLLMIK